MKSSDKRDGLRPSALALAGGLVLWFMTAHSGGRPEPWDAPLFWTVAYPLALVYVGAIAWRFPERSWRWALLVIFAQLPVMLANGAAFSLWPLAAIALGVLSLPALLVTTLVERRRRARTLDAE